MQYRQPVPFYTTYPFLFPDMQEREQERDLQVMRSYYSHRAQRIQEKVERECDRMEYEGSMMYDEYPDKFMLYHTCQKIRKDVEPEMQTQNVPDRFLDEMIQVLLYQEIGRRRCRRHRCRRFW